MNKYCYRLVFSKARGILVAVAESAKSRSKSAGQSDSRVQKPESARSTGFRLTTLACALSIYLQPFHAMAASQIKVDGAAPTNQRATLLQSNGVPVVNIRTPNANGLSMNKYTQFDIDTNGAVLNNSRGSVDTVLAGSIAGNQWMSAGTAKTIVNQIRSANPTLLKGVVEIAGDRADLIIASPSGINIQDAGFINANRATLTTGTPGILNGKLESINVTKGTITVNGDPVSSNGLGFVSGASGQQVSTPYIDLLARAVKVNAKVQAQNLNIATGTNKIVVPADGGSEYEVNPVTSTASKPSVFLDVGQLGSLTAGSIFMIGTEQGLGVKNAGVIQANNVILTNEGKIVNSGLISGSSDQDSFIYISSTGTGTNGDIENTGKITSQGSVYLEAGHDLKLSQSEVSSKLNGLDNSGGVQLSAQNNLIINNSKIENQNLGELSLLSGSDLIATGLTATTQGGDLKLQADKSVTLSTSQLQALGDSAQSLVLSGHSALIKDSTISATKNVAIQSGFDSEDVTAIEIQGSQLSGPEDVALISAGNISLANNDFKSKQFRTNSLGSTTLDFSVNKFDQDVDLIFKAENLNMLGSLKKVYANSIETLSNNFNLSGVGFNTTEDIRFTTNSGDININLESNILNSGKNLDIQSLNGYLNITGLRPRIIAKENINLISGLDMNIDANGLDLLMQFKSGKDTNLYSNKRFSLGNTHIDSESTNIFSENDLDIYTVNLYSLENILINTVSNLDIGGSLISAKNTISFNAGKDLNLYKRVDTNNYYKYDKENHVSSNKNLMFSSGGENNLKDSYIESNNVQILSKGVMNLNNTNLSTLSYGASTETIKGGIILNSNQDINIHGKSYIKADSDVIINSKNGDIDIDTEGRIIKYSNLKRQNIYSAFKDVNILGSSVRIDGANILADKGNINVQSSEGDIVIDSLKFEFDNFLSTKKVNNLKAEINNTGIQEEIDLKYAYRTELENQLAARKAYFVKKHGWQGAIAVAYDPVYMSINDKIAQTNNQINDLKSEISFLTRALDLATTTPSKGFENSGSLIKAAGDLNISSEGGILVQGSSLEGKNSINLMANGVLDTVTTNDLSTSQVSAGSTDQVLKSSILITGVMDQYEAGLPTDSKYWLSKSVDRSKLSSDGDINIISFGGEVDKSNLILNAVSVESKLGDINIRSLNGNVLLEASQNTDIDITTTKKTKKKWYGKKKTTITRSETQSSTAAGVSLVADDITVTANSDIKAYATEFLPSSVERGTVKLIAGDKVQLFAVEEIYDTNVDTKTSSSWIGIDYSKSKSNSSRLEIDNLTTKLVSSYTDIQSGDNTELYGTDFDTLKGASIQAGVGHKAKADAQVIFYGVRDSVTTANTFESENLAWFKNSGEGGTVTTLKLPTFTQTPYVKAPGGVVIDVGVDVDANQTKALLYSQEELGAMALELSKQPGFEYIAELDAQNAINWQAVQLIQDHWEYEAEGLTAAASILISLAVAIATAGTSLTAAPALALAGGQGVVATGLSAGFVGLYSQAAVTLINNKGDIGQTLDDMASSATIRSFATSAITAGVLDKLNLSALKDFQGDALSDRLIRATVEASASAVVSSSINGGSFEDSLLIALQTGVANALQGFAATEIKLNDPQYFIHKLLHAAAGCAAAAAASSDCKSGAIGAAIGEIIAESLISGRDVADLTIDEKNNIRDITKLSVGSIALAGGYDVNAAISSAAIAVDNNSLKAVTTTVKIGKKVVDLLVTKGKVSATDFKRVLKEEGFDIISDAITLTDGVINYDDVRVIIDLAVGTDLNKQNPSTVSTKIDQLLNRRGLANNQFSQKDLKQHFSNKGYTEAGKGKEKYLENTSGSKEDPPFLVRTWSSHNGDVAKGYTTREDAKKAARHQSNQDRTGGYDLNLKWKGE